MVVKVVDASAIAALLFNEPEAERVATVLDGCVLAAPTLLEYEIGHTCWKMCRRHAESAAALRQALGGFSALGIKLHAVDLVEALVVAERFELTVYDASYLWLARRLQAPLVSLDRRLGGLA